MYISTSVHTIHWYALHSISGMLAFHTYGMNHLWYVFHSFWYELHTSVLTVKGSFCSTQIKETRNKKPTQVQTRESWKSLIPILLAKNMYGLNNFFFQNSIMPQNLIPCFLTVIKFLQLHSPSKFLFLKAL